MFHVTAPPNRWNTARLSSTSSIVSLIRMQKTSDTKHKYTQPRTLQPSILYESQNIFKVFLWKLGATQEGLLYTQAFLLPQAGYAFHVL